MTFQPDTNAGTKGPRSSAITDENGHYQLYTDAGDLDAVAGRHQVRLERLAPSNRGISTREPRPRQADGVAKPKPKNDVAVLREVEVRPGPQTLDFDLSSSSDLAFRADAS